MVQMVKNLHVIWETWVQSLGWEDLWRRAWQLTPVLLPGESPWTEEPGGLQSMGLQRVGHDWATKCMHARARTHTHTHTHTQAKSEFQMTSENWHGTLTTTVKTCWVLALGGSARPSPSPWSSTITTLTLLCEMEAKRFAQDSTPGSLEVGCEPRHLALASSHLTLVSTAL